jgi:hypothetical protein
MAEGREGHSISGAHCGCVLLAERLGTVLMERGLRLTAPRKALVDAVAAQAWSGPSAEFSPASLLEHCQNSRPGVVSRATVYRTLELLCAAGLVAACGGERPPGPAGAAQHPDRLSATARAEVRLLDGAGRQLLLAANAELLRVLRSLCQRSGFQPETFAIEIRGEFKP